MIRARATWWSAALLSALHPSLALAEEARTATRAEAGPRLELEGLDVETASVGAAPAAPQDRPPPKDPFEERTNPFNTLADRAAAIVDRTTLGGYGEVTFMTSPSEVASFQHHRFVLFVYSQIHERISLATEIELEFAGSPLKRDGTLGHGEVLLEFAVIDFRLFDWLVMRAGVILMPIGALNLRHDSPTQDLTDRPIAYTTIVPSTWFETGAGFHGTIPLGDQRLRYEVYLVNGLDASIADGQGFRGARGSHFEDNNNDKGIAARIAYSPALALELGVSGYTGEYDLTGHRVNLANLDATWRLGALELLGEAVVAKIDPGFTEGFAPGSVANTRSAVPEGMWGFYLQANYHFTIPPLWALFPDWLQHSVLTAVLRYEGRDTDVNHDSDQGDRRRLTFGLNFRPIEAFVIKTDYQLDARGIDEQRGAPDLWNGAFWETADFRFLTSAAFLF